MSDNLWKHLEDPVVRVAVFEDNFPLFFLYHYGWAELTDFHMAWMESLQSKNDTMIVGFRGSRKTTIVRGYIVWCCCYKKEPSIVWQSYEDGLSADSVRETAKMMNKKSIVNDYGLLFPFETKATDMAKRSLSNFETTNGVKVASKSLGQTLRGTNTYDQEAEMSSRPTLLVLDDIDVTKSVNNVDIIRQNEQKITGETIGSLDPLRRKIIFLGNVINEDGIVPRFREKYKNAKTWDCFWQPLIDEKNVNVRPEVFTDQVVAKLKEDGNIAFNNNYLLIPSQVGSGVFTRAYFDYFLLSHFEDPDSPLKKKDLKCALFIDPAFSSNDDSDDAVVLGIGEHKASKKKYLIDGYADTSAPSKTYNAVLIMINNMTADGFEPQFISVENASISKKQTTFIKDLKAFLLENNVHIPVFHYTSFQGKNDRIKFNLEAPMSQHGLAFNRNMSDRTFIPRMETQFLEFPHGDKDDIIDTVSQGFEVFRKGHVETKPAEQPRVQTPSLLTRQTPNAGAGSQTRRSLLTR